MYEIGMSTIMTILKIAGRAAAIIMLILGIVACIGHIIDNVSDIKSYGKYYMKETRHEEIFAIIGCICAICVFIFLLSIACGIVVINMNR
jgi:hypothetical protein